MVADDKVVIEIMKILVDGINAESIENVGVLPVPKVVAGGKLGPVKFRSATSLTKERGAITRQLQAAGISRPVARALMLLHRQQPIVPRISFNPVQQEQIRVNLIRRAQYLLNAARRLQREIDSQRSLPGNSKLSMTKAMVGALRQEQRYYGLHLKASHEREMAASQIDLAAQQYGSKLGWYTILDDRTSSDCLEASGKNFYSYKQPAIGWPGMTHPTCRCWAGPPHATSETVYGIKER